MNKINKQQLFAIAGIACTLLSMLFTGKAQDEEMRQIKEEIKSELKQEKENQNG